MAFPYTYKLKFVFDNDAHLATHHVFESIIYAFQDVHSQEYLIKPNSIAFTEKMTLLPIKYNTVIRVISVADKIRIEAEVKLMELITLILLLTIIVAFFAKLSVDNLFIFSFLFAISFYTGTIFFIQDYLSKRIRQSSFYQSLYPDQENIQIQQQQWMDDPNKCSACGCDTDSDDVVCPECGLQLKANRHSKPMDVSKYKNNKVNYHYKKKEDKK